MKRSVWIRIFLIIILLLISPVLVLSQIAKAPALTLKDINGRTFRLSDHQGQVVLINFWATWCPPCRAEIPELVKLQRQYRSAGLQIIGITYPPEKLSAVRNFSSKLRINYPLARGTRRTKLLFTSSEILPITVVVDRDGNVADLIEGILLPEEFETKIKPLLSSPTKRLGTKLVLLEHAVANIPMLRRITFALNNWCLLGAQLRPSSLAFTEFQAIVR